jgi:hypothetical protein
LEGSTEVLSLDVTPSTIWVGLRRGGRVGAVREIDRATGDVLAELDDVDIPARTVIAFDSAWITDSGSSNVLPHRTGLAIAVTEGVGCRGVEASRRACLARLRSRRP